MLEPTDPSIIQSTSGDEAQDKLELIPRDGNLASKTEDQDNAIANTVPASEPHVENYRASEEASHKSSGASTEPEVNSSQDGILPKEVARTAVLELIRGESGRKIYLDRFEPPTDSPNRVLSRLEASHEQGLTSVPEMPVALYRSLILPTFPKRFGSARELFDSIGILLKKHFMLHKKERSILTYWSIGTWFLDFLPFLPTLVLTGHACAADLLLRTLVAVCRRPILLADVSPAILRALPLGELMPTLLIREPQLSKRMAALLDASTQPGYLLPRGKDFQQFFCAKCVYVGEDVNNQILPSNSIHIHVGGKLLRHLPLPPADDVIQDFQNRLLSYRVVHHDLVAASTFSVSGFRLEMCAVAKSFGALVDDPELQGGIIELLKERDEQSRVDRASEQNGTVLRAVLWHCHHSEQEQVFVREIAVTANQLYREEGESLQMSNETVGHVLKNLGLYTRRLGNTGRGLILDKATQSRAHELSHANEVLPDGAGVPACGHCHKLQLLETQEVV